MGMNPQVGDFTTKKKAFVLRDSLASDIRKAKKSDSPINLRVRVLKKGGRFKVVEESLRKGGLNFS